MCQLRIMRDGTDLWSSNGETVRSPCHRREFRRARERGQPMLSIFRRRSPVKIQGLWALLWSGALQGMLEGHASRIMLFWWNILVRSLHAKGNRYRLTVTTATSLQTRSESRAVSSDAVLSRIQAARTAPMKQRSTTLWLQRMTQILAEPAGEGECEMNGMKTG